MPLITEIDFAELSGNFGIHVFIMGVAVYFSTWLCLIYYPNSRWSKSLIGFYGPGFTPIIWLVGFAFTVNGFNVAVAYNIWFYLVPSILFVAFHGVHSVMAFGNSINGVSPSFR